MVLRSALGGWENKHKVGFVGKKAIGSLSILFFDIWNRLLPACEPAAEAIGCVSSKVLVFLL